MAFIPRYTPKCVLNDFFCERPLNHTLLILIVNMMHTNRPLLNTHIAAFSTKCFKYWMPFILHLHFTKWYQNCCLSSHCKHMRLLNFLQYICTYIATFKQSARKTCVPQYKICRLIPVPSILGHWLISLMGDSMLKSAAVVLLRVTCCGDEYAWMVG